MKSIKTILIILFLLSLPALAVAENIPNPLEKLVGPNATVIEIVIKGFAGFAGLFSMFAFGFLIFNGFKLIIARDNEEKITIAKSGILWSALGFVVAILSFSIISATFNFLGGVNRNELTSPDTIQPPIAEAGFLGVFKVVISGVLGLSFLASVIAVVYAGARMILSGGNEEQVTKAKTILKWAVAGMVVIILSYTIISSINAIFS